MDKAVEAETRASEAEIRMKEMKVGCAVQLYCTEPARSTHMTSPSCLLHVQVN
jgi:hypothetical protein